MASHLAGVGQLSQLAKLWVSPWSHLVILTCVFGVDRELVDLVCSALLESLTPRLHLGRVAFGHEQLERRVGNVFSVLEHVHRMLADFIGRKQDSCTA